MMISWKSIFLLFFLTLGIISSVPAACTHSSQWNNTRINKPEYNPGIEYSSIPDQVNPDEYYIFYIHGAIIETEGVDAVSPEFGLYEFSKILEYFSENGYNVIAEIRGPTSDSEPYTDHIIESVKYLHSQGVPSPKIAVMGFSKGAGITSDVSSRLDDPNIKYILIAICGDWLDQNLKLTGRVLSLFEESDRYGSSCKSLADRSPDLTSFQEIQFSTGEGHGAFYQADPLWMDPVITWIENLED